MREENAMHLMRMQVGSTFLWFQWDTLLLELGFIAIVLAPLLRRRYMPHDNIGLFLMKWLGFRLMFASGVVKLQSQCPTWWGLSGSLFRTFISVNVLIFSVGAPLPESMSANSACLVCAPSARVGTQTVMRAHLLHRDRHAYLVPPAVRALTSLCVLWTGECILLILNYATHFKGLSYATHRRHR